MSSSANTDLPTEYVEYIKRLAKQLTDAGVITGCGETAVVIAGLNLLHDFLQRMEPLEEEERALQLGVIADLAKPTDLKFE